MKRERPPTKLLPEQVKGLRIAYRAGDFCRLEMRAAHEYVAMHFLTLQDEHLHLTLMGGWGDCTYEWWHTGGKGLAGAIKFAVGMADDPRYLVDKMKSCMGGDEFQPHETMDAMKERILSRRRDQEIDAETARDAWEEIERCDESECDVRDLLWDNTKAFGDDYGELWCMGPPRQLVYLCYAVYPVFTDLLKTLVQP